MLHDELKARRLRLTIRKSFVSRATLNAKLGSRIRVVMAGNIEQKMAGCYGLLLRNTVRD